MFLSRRFLLRAAPILIAAPAIVRASSLMAVKPLLVPSAAYVTGIPIRFKVATAFTGAISGTTLTIGMEVTGLGIPPGWRILSVAHGRGLLA